MKKNNNYTNGDVPLGLGMALAQNIGAMQYFSSLSPEEQQQIISRAHNVNSKEEMQAFVSNLSQMNG